jgi:hypothetical protein
LVNWHRFLGNFGETLSGSQEHVISPQQLIWNKLESGRLQDLADVEAIREADKSNESRHA